MTASTRLAALGGEPAVPEGTIKPWPPIDDIDRRLVLESLNSDRHSFGPNCAAFQEEFAEWNGNKFCTTCNSGTAALHMGVAACGCGVGDEVIVTAYSWSSSATCVLHHDAIPVFVDIDWETMCIDVDKIEAAITPRTKAIVVVHLHGLPVDMDRVMAIAEQRGLKVIEDACQAHGARWRGRKVGTLGHCAAFSCNQNKCLCSGEGGLFVTNDEQIHEDAKRLWSFGETRTPLEERDYHAYALGWMYRNNDLTAAFGRAQLKRLDHYLAVQKENAAALNERLQGINALILPTEPEGHTHNWYNYTIRIDMDAIGWTADPTRMRDAVRKALDAEGVGSSIYQRYILPAMTVFQAKNAYGKGSPWAEHDSLDVDYDPAHFPVARRHSQTHIGMTTPLRAPNRTDIAQRVAEAFHKVFDHIGRIDPDDILEEDQ